MALAHYDRHIPFFDGSVSPEGIELEVLEVGQGSSGRHGTDRHERMLRDQEFDLCEVSLSSYLMAKSCGTSLTAIPVFPRRLFSQSLIYCNTASGIRKPSDLIGKRVGVNSFQTTLAVLAKGDLKFEYGVPWQEIEWHTINEETISFGTLGSVVIHRIPPSRKIDQMLLAGELDAVALPHPPASFLEHRDRVRRLFPDAKKEEADYFQRNGFYPIMHVMAVKGEVLSENPWVAASMMAAFEKAKQVSAGYYEDPNWSRLAWAYHLLEEERQVLGADPWPSGVSRNRANLERMIMYSHDQGLLQGAIGVNDLFHESLWDT
jgi:4,5-dihydroxyphthalate decarboxylase